MYDYITYRSPTAGKTPPQKTAAKTAEPDGIPSQGFQAETAEAPNITYHRLISSTIVKILLISLILVWFLGSYLFPLP